MELDPQGNGPSAIDHERSDQPIEREPALAGLSVPARDRIQQFVADSTAKGGASPADVADLYTSPEIMGDEEATGYLDRRYVHGVMPADWRQLQDQLTAVQAAGPPGLSGAELLARAEQEEQLASAARSIFDDPELLDEDVDERAARTVDRQPSLADLTDEGRQAIERHLVAEALCYGVAPAQTMRLREQLSAAGDERSLQYLDIPFELGQRPPDWDELRDRALRLRARLEALGRDSADLFARTEAAHPELDARELLTLLESSVDRG